MEVTGAMPASGTVTMLQDKVQQSASQCIMLLKGRQTMLQLRPNRPAAQYCLSTWSHDPLALPATQLPGTRTRPLQLLSAS